MEPLRNLQTLLLLMKPHLPSKQIDPLSLKNRCKINKMFFFFVGGLEQQVRQLLKSGAGRCINCNSPADLVGYEKVLKLFFVPVWRWPGKEPLMHCNNCNLFFPLSFSPPPISDQSTPPAALSSTLRCCSCNRVVEPDFSFCPSCGSSL